MIRIGIFGATGYTGLELLKLLGRHPAGRIAWLTSENSAGQQFGDIFPVPPALGGHTLIPSAEADCTSVDVVFCCLPHVAAQTHVAAARKVGARAIDLSADFRLRDAATYEKWYGHPHRHADLLAEAVYGLAEVNREAMRKARLIAAPGCYPTSVQLGLIPLLEADLIDTQTLIANAASGVSGAGKQAKVDNLYAEVNDSFKAYGVGGHRHLPEIEQGLNQVAKQPVQLTFVPHLVPMTRGIHSTLYARLKPGVTGADLQALFEQRYAGEPFVDVMPKGSTPQTRSVRGANVCRLAVHQPQGRDTVVVLAVIDNLVKGASGQALQAMNIMFGLAETTGLGAPALLP